MHRSGNLQSQVAQVLLIGRLRGRHEVERRVDARATGVADEVAPVERIVAEVVEVLDVVVGGRELGVRIGGGRREVLGRIDAGLQLHCSLISMPYLLNAKYSDPATSLVTVS